MKSGTHLIQELMIGLGYGMVGQSRITDRERATPSESDLAEFADRLAGVDLTDTHGDVWEAVSWAWQSRFGAPLSVRYGESFVRDRCLDDVLARIHTLPFAATPPRTCWILPELWLDRIDGSFVQEWAASGEPRIVFNHRDPRASFVSMVNFLSGATAAGFGKFSTFLVFAEILRPHEGLDAKVVAAVTNPEFPVRSDFRRALWLLQHPQVLNVRFEDLVGANGGGSDSDQRSAITTICRHLSFPEPPEELTLFNPESFSFHRGTIDGWREDLSPATIDLLNETFADELALYGYDE